MSEQLTQLCPPRLDGRNLPCFPCKGTKRPATPHGFWDATADPANFAVLCHQYPGPLIGVPSGDGSGFDVLDIDPPGLAWLTQYRDRLPDTRIHETRSGGRHIFFRHGPGLRCSASRIALGVDVRADGGYVIWWPAAGYPVLKDVPVAPWPEWLLAEAFKSGNGHLLVQREVPIQSGHSLSVHPRSREASYAHVAFKRAQGELLNARRGERNTKLNVLAYSLGRLAARGWITRDKIVQGLEPCAKYIGLVADDGASQVRATIESGLAAGMSKPYPDL